MISRRRAAEIGESAQSLAGGVRPTEARPRELLATLVRVPEIDGTFLEIETLVDEDDVSSALDDIRALLAELAIGSEELTRELYTDTDAVATQRH